MERQDKLVANLRLGLEDLRKDVISANKILEKIDLKKLKLEAIDSKTASESLKYLRLIEKEIDNIKKSGGNNTALDGISKTVVDLTKTLSQVGIQTTKIMNQTVKDADGTTVAMKKLEESIDAVGNKYSKITNMDSKGSTTSTVESATQDIAKQTKELEKLKLAELDVLKTNYNSLGSSGKERIEDLKKLADNVQNIIDKHELEGKTLVQATAQKKKYLDESTRISSEINKEIEKEKKSNLELIESIAKVREQSELRKKQDTRKEELEQAKAINKELEEEYKNKQKIAEVQEKVNQAQLKEYTQSALQENNGQKKTLSGYMSSISGDTGSKTLGSGDARNKGFWEKFDVAKDYVISSKVLNLAIAAMDEAYTSIKSYETGLVDLSRTLDNVTNQDLKQFGQQAIQFSKDFGVPLEEVQNAMTELARAGVDNKDDLFSMTKTVLT